MTVSQLNEYVNGLLKSDSLLSHVCVCGEISGFKRHSSGHLYFSIKDEGALVRCVMFRQNAFSLDFSPQDGQSVLIYGSVSVYVKDGQYQLYVTAMERQGEGELYRRFMLMKTRLEAKGYFDEEHKRPIPYLPKCVGVVTSPTGAAIQDIINITRRRFPTMNILLYPVRVQGDGAAEEIAEAIYAMNHIKKADVLIVGRGGGSMEDLWPFNEEIVAKAIYESKIPVVSAVGHETDFSIADFTADLRAPTPSAAAELCVPEYVRLCGDIIAAQNYISERCHKEMDNLRQRLSGIRDSAAFSMTRHRIEMLNHTLEMQRDNMSTLLRSEIVNAVHLIEKQQSRLNALSPEAVLERGYGMVQQDGRFVGGADELKEQHKALLIMKNGKADITIDRISRG
ncbi:MAG: exodeoxyribonuclease VII large subunit [Clostridia bacterium]|nr:exodeoxyribonuclease VII large subunit [Clostridia bacterium]